MLAALAVAEQRETAAASQHSGGQASEGPREDPRPVLGTALGATVSAWQWHSAGTGSSSPARGAGFEQPYGAQAQERGGAADAQTPLNRQPISMPLCVAGCKDQIGQKWLHRAVQKECSPPELLAAHDTQLQTWSGMTGTVQTQERGGAGRAQPPLNLSNYIMYNFQCKVQHRHRPFFSDP